MASVVGNRWSSASSCLSLGMLLSAVIGSSVLVCGGCAVGRGDPTLTSDDPALKVPAMHRAGRTDATRSVPKLINDLENSDPAIRMFAAKSLEQITRETHGYRFYDDEPVRAVAVKAWREAYGLPTDPPRTLTTQPTTSPAMVPATVPATAMAKEMWGAGR